MKHGRLKCAKRVKPYCSEGATVVVGQYGYCPEHTDEAQTSLDTWKAERVRERTAAPPAAVVPFTPAEAPKPQSVIQRFIADLTTAAWTRANASRWSQAWLDRYRGARYRLCDWAGGRVPESCPSRLP